MKKASLGAVTALGIALALLVAFSLSMTGSVVIVKADPPVEICDYKDNDDDGLCFGGTNNGKVCTSGANCPGGSCIKYDEDFTYNGKAVGTSCDGIGECGTGLVYCVNENTAGCSTNPGGQDDESQLESCDYLDNDCDTMSDEDFTYNGKAVGTSCDGIGECGTGLVYCLNQNTTQCSTNPGSPDDESQPEVCDNKDNDCDASVDEGIAPQACGGGLCAGSKNCSTGGMWGACSTVYKDGGTCAICNYEGAPVYDGTQDEDCAGYSYDPIGTCLNNPDNSPFTWDSCLGFTSECFDIDTCTQQPKSFTHECSKSGCGAECASDGDCANGYCKGPVGGCGCRLNGDVVAVPPLSRVVNIYDLAAIGISFNTHPGDMNWNAEADVHPRGGDGKVGIFDLAFVGMNYGHSY